MATIIAEHIVGTIEKVSLNDNKGRILLNDGTWLSWFQTDLKGNITAPHASFQQNHVAEGQTWQIKYTSKPSADGRMIFKNVLSFSPANGIPQQNQQAQTPNQQTAPFVAPVNTDYEQKKEAEVIGKTASLFLSAYITGAAMGNADWKLEMAQPQVDQAVMLAEKLVNAAKGPRRKRPAPAPAQISSHPLAVEEDFEGDGTEPEDIPEWA